MISQEDFNVIVTFDSATNQNDREQVINQYRTQVAKTFFHLLGHISKDQTIQYLLILMDEMITEDR